MTTWTATRGDLKKFYRDVVNSPGKKYYATTDVVQPWGDARMYREIVFKPSRLWGATWGHHGVEGVLSLYGPITDVKPDSTKVKPLFDDGGKQHHPEIKPAKKRILARR
ncbi:hypothetical protein [Streptomyces niveus]|jgi:hypothetical protein|uniref:hypothetical protein n=1 Tax=Streptomyces niveus TaxID=193462 RepID=UPI00386D13D7